MTIHLEISPEERGHRAALWRIALGRLTNDSMASTAATQQLLPLVMHRPVEDVLVVCADAAADVLAHWGDEIGKNPACLGETAFNMLHQKLAPPERLVLLAAWKTLEASDPTGESGSPHPTCYPWPATAAVASLRQAGGGAVFNNAVSACAQTNGLEEHPAMGLVMAAPGVLTQLAWGRAGSNPDHMRTLIEAELVA